MTVTYKPVGVCVAARFEGKPARELLTGTVGIVPVIRQEAVTTFAFAPLMRVVAATNGAWVRAVESPDTCLHLLAPSPLMDCENPLPVGADASLRV
jgi:hypothetical protein